MIVCIVLCFCFNAHCGNVHTCIEAGYSISKSTGALLDKFFDSCFNIFGDRALVAREYSWTYFPNNWNDAQKREFYLHYFSVQGKVHRGFHDASILHLENGEIHKTNNAGTERQPTIRMSIRNYMLQENMPLEHTYNASDRAFQKILEWYLQFHAVYIEVAKLDSVQTTTHLLTHLASIAKSEKSNVSREVKAYNELQAAFKFVNKK